MSFPNHIELVTRDGIWVATCLRCGNVVKDEDLNIISLEMQRHACGKEREAGRPGTRLNEE